MSILLGSAFCILLVAALVQAVTGFGFALVAIPLLTVIVEPRTAVVGCSLVALMLTTFTAFREREHVRWRTTAALLAAALAGIPLGLVVLTQVSEAALTVVIAMVVLTFTVLVWRGLRIPATMPTLGVVGVLVGALSTATGINGPPLVATFQAMEFDQLTFRATLAAVFCGSGVLAVTGFAAAGQVTLGALTITLVGPPAIGLGWLLGNRVFHRIDRQWFRRLVLTALLATAGSTLIVALW